MTEYNPSAGMTGFDELETLLPTYWNTSFSKICLGMKIDQQINFILLDKVAESLHSLIADGQYRNTSLLVGRNTWKMLVGSDASLQLNCNKEGFNAYTSSDRPKARIGILGVEARAQHLEFLVSGFSHVTSGSRSRKTCSVCKLKL